MTYGARAGARNRQIAASYAQVGLETEVMSASPEKLIALLFAGARTSIAKAKIYFNNGNIEERGKAIAKAIDIVTGGLRAAVDESAGEIATSLVTAYGLISHHLLLANLRSDTKHLEIADSILADLQSAWCEATGLTNHSI